MEETNVEFTDFDVMLLGFPGWESENIVRLISSLGPKVVTGLELLSRSRPVVIFYNDGHDVEGVRSAREENVIWVCLSSNYSQEYCANFSLRSLDYLLLRPVDKMEVRMILKEVKNELEKRNLRKDFLNQLNKYEDAEGAVQFCQNKSGDERIRKTALKELVKYFDSFGNEKDYLLNLKTAFYESPFDYKLIKRMLDYLEKSEGKLRIQESLLHDLLCLYPTDVSQLIKLDRLLILGKNFKQTLSYLELVSEFKASPEKLKKLRVALLFVTIKFYTQQNRPTLVEKHLNLLIELNPSDSIMSDLKDYADELGRNQILTLYRTYTQD